MNKSKAKKWDGVHCVICKKPSKHFIMGMCDPCSDKDLASFMGVKL